MHANEDAAPLPPPGGTILGHPRLAWMLFAITIGFNFAFYGFRAFLAPYVADAFFTDLPHAEALRQADFLFAGFGSLNYALAILGGWVADNVLGEVQSLRLGVWLIIAGLVAMAVPNEHLFLLGLAFDVLAVGLTIPLTVLIGRNYTLNDPKREAGYTLYYMAINLGSFIAPFICAGWVAVHYGYRWGFIAAAAGELIAAIVFEWKHRRVIGASKPPRLKRAWSTPAVVVIAIVLSFPAAFMLAHPDAMNWFVYALFLVLVVYFIVSSVRRGERTQSHRYVALLLLFVPYVAFWALSLLSASAINFFARDYVTPLWHGSLLGLIPWSYLLFQSANPLYILLFAVPVALLWPALDRHAINPSTPRKFGIGLLLVALGYGALWYAIEYLQLPGGKVAAWTLALYYLLATIGELALSPIGYGVIGKLAAEDEASLAMGGWFFGVAVSYNLAGQIAAFTTAGGILAYQHVFEWLLVGGAAIALVYLLSAPWVLKLMHGVR
ncbi:MAG TPA: oligopeptide:H+ symporter [Rhodanobacteraceae bacterium]|nr:oligopeptide:H+ symporter [Rhodanobacteraceae bacterium]